MRLYRASRRELFERLDQSQLRPLPAEPFVYGEWKLGARVSIDYHVELHGHYYSVPYALIHELVDACLTATTVELFHRGQRVAAHVRSVVRGRHTTEPAHMPKAHQHHLEWTPSRLITWARTIGARGRRSHWRFCSPLMSTSAGRSTTKTRPLRRRRGRPPRPNSARTGDS